jgi:two-component system, sensor histidine kinase
MDLVPDVLIVDQRLGGDETGPDVVERLRDELNEDVRAIMMTGDISVETEREDGALRVLHKPVEPELLHRLLGEIAREKAEREPA